MRAAKLLLLLLFIVSLPGFSAEVDTVAVRSNAMNKDIKTVVVKPDSYGKQDSFPVVYLLHGFSGRYDSWVKDSPEILELSDNHKVILVCPDGDFDSWYWDLPDNPDAQYETFVSKELVSWIDKNYKTIPSIEGRAITGLSMGGHGGLYLGFRHQDTYGACGSMSGGVDIIPFVKNWNMEKKLGSPAENPEAWHDFSVMGQLHKLLPNGTLKIIIDCGVDDFFYHVNEKLHEELLYRNIPHDYITRPGAHNWNYWRNAIKYQILYFSEFFYNK
ncbi:MAG: alpha/beta hydrolase [Fermentimonas sp.]|jgi:S-formylglutathione hydrolase FrmB